MHQRFLTDPRPDNEVVQALEIALDAARRGRIRTLLILTVNPLQESENHVFGDLGEVKRKIVLGELSVARHQLLEPNE